MENLILIINPGATSTKVALYKGETELCTETLDHDAAELSEFKEINDQYDMRMAAVMNFLDAHNVKPEEIDGIAARGGCIAELETGAYYIDEHFVDLAMNTINPHASNLAIKIAYELGKVGGAKPYTYDPSCATGKPDEVYTLSGMPAISRPFITHVLNSRAVAFEQAKRDNTSIYENTYIVCHLGGGCSTNLLVNGTIVDYFGDDENCFTPERAGGVPCRKLVRLCFSGKYTEKEVQKMLKGNGGLKAYLGTTDIREVQKMIEEGDEFAKVVFDAMVLQLAKNVGSMATVVDGKVDKIIITGGIANSKMFMDALVKKIEFLAPVAIIPGTFEMEALAAGINRVLNGEEEAQIYTGGPMTDEPSRSRQ